MFLLVILGGTFTVLFRQRRAELLEVERNRQDVVFEDVAVALGKRARQRDARYPVVT